MTQLEEYSFAKQTLLAYEKWHVHFWKKGRRVRMC